MKGIAQTLSIPEVELQKCLVDSFYVTINKGYTATVRNLGSLIDFLQMHPNDPDETFGSIVKEAKNEEGQIEDMQFYGYLLKIIGFVSGMPTFNTCRHTFVKLEEKKHTFSVQTKFGKLVTLAFNDDECIDVQVHNSGLPTENNGASEVPQFNLIGFNCGDTPVRTTTVTVAAIMLNDRSGLVRNGEKLEK